MERDLLLIATSLFTWGIGEGLFFYFLPLSLQDWGANPVLIGAVYGGIGVATAIAQIPAGYLSDKIGSRSIMRLSWIIGTIACWVMALSRSMQMFVIGVWFYFLTAFVVAPLNSFTTQIRGKLSVGRALTFTGGMFSLGAIAGPILGGLIADHFGIQRIYIFSASIFIISTIIIFTLKRRPIKKMEVDAGGTHLLKNKRFLIFLAISFFAIMFIYFPQPLTPNYLQDQMHLSRTAIGLLGTIGNIGSTFATLVLGILPSTLALFLGQGMVALFAILLWKGQSPLIFALAYFVLGGYRLNRAMIISKVRSFVREKEVGLAFGILETVTGLAIILAPVTAGWIYSANPVSIYPIGFALICIAGLANAFFFIRFPSSRIVNAKEIETHVP